jgi:hypothetical protein
MDKKRQFFSQVRIVCLFQASFKAKEYNLRVRLFLMRAELFFIFNSGAYFLKFGSISNVKTQNLLSVAGN